MKIKRIILFLFISIVISCSTKEKSKKSIIAVLVDVSTSSNFEFQAFEKELSSILEVHETASKIFVLPVNSENNQVLNDGNAIIRNRVSDAEKEQEKERLEVDIAQIINDLKNIPEDEKKWTCIVNALEKTIRIFKDKYKDHPFGLYDYKVIIFSDMNESCMYTPIGKGEYVEMENKKEEVNSKLATLEVAQNKLANYEAPKMAFDTTNFEIIIIDRKNKDNPRVLKLKENIWFTIFEKLNYHFPENENLISTDYEFKK